ncbi:glycosyltransferase family 25 protein [Actinoallomurus sp. NBC_01490]|uniref:glycosyltransferase family 25 protein n=1 Tax=Actinoallomurus sp. NBC_01490 TaxID=2903557 RepID=UPI002E31C361|nr:glycosyltransferase family 25 protein [Actinoallomurus sp. NBC_01490]
MTASTIATEIQTYVVNLRRRTDRRERMRQILPAQLNATYTCEWNGPFDGRSLSLAHLDRRGYQLFPWRIPSANPWWNRPLKLGEVGCSLSHLACWRQAATRSEPYTLVLEDDAVFAPDFLENLLRGLDLLNPHGFDLLYLGRYPLEPDRAVLPGFVAPGYSHCTFGYLLTRRAVRELLAAELERAIIPADEFLPAMYTPHPRPDIRTRFPPRLTALAFDPPLVRQLPKDVAGSDTENSAFVVSPNDAASAG